jgi:hypothetical protein
VGLALPLRLCFLICISRQRGRAASRTSKLARLVGALQSPCVQVCGSILALSDSVNARHEGSCGRCCGAVCCPLHTV